MKTSAIVCSAVLAAAFMSGCTPRYADTPTPTRFESSKQAKLQAADHWRIIADNFAVQISSDLRQKGVTQALHVPTDASDFAFVEGFRELLTTALLAQGWDMRTSPRNALTVDVRYSIYKFSPERARSIGYHGEATALVAGLWAVSGIVDGGMSAGAKALTVAALADGGGWLLNSAPDGPRLGQFASGAIPRSEILVTAAVTDGERILARRSNIYFTADEDPGLYWEQSKHVTATATATEIRVKGE